MKPKILKKYIEIRIDNDWYVWKECDFPEAMPRLRFLEDHLIQSKVHPK